MARASNTQKPSRRQASGATRDTTGSGDAALIQSKVARSRIAPDLFLVIDSAGGRRGGRSTSLRAARDVKVPVIVEMNDRYPLGSAAARGALLALYFAFKGGRPSSRPPAGIEMPSLPKADTLRPEPSRTFASGDEIDVDKSLFTTAFLFGRLAPSTIDALSALTVQISKNQRASLVYKIWSEHKVQRCVFQSAKTIKADAARAAFAAAGEGIVWAVADTGVDGGHAHFRTHRTLDLPSGLMHRDFTTNYADDVAAQDAALQDIDGHGTHVSGIIAGETRPEKNAPISVAEDARQQDGTVAITSRKHETAILGVAPLCKVLSLKVLQTGDGGDVSSILAAIGYVQRLNDFGRDVKVHGLNISLGYSFDPEWFAPGHSPLCTEVDRLVRMGTVVVIAAGNSGLTTVINSSGSSARASQTGTIADPGNAALAITVGSTHRDSPHTYGISFFSGKGPTGDGRLKPDLVAPGERIVSCALSGVRPAGSVPFREDSGTSMAAPHVSGAAAAFLSVRREFIGQAERVKQILTSSAMDLGRRVEFQGAGLVDVMRALQSV